MIKPGKELRVGDTIEVWWAPRRDTIIQLEPYRGPIGNIWPDGAQLASFALNKSGMTIDNSDNYVVIASAGTPTPEAT